MSFPPGYGLAAPSGGAAYRTCRALVTIAALSAMVSCAHDEVCDWEDNDNDGLIDEGFDADNDGSWACGLTQVHYEANDYDCNDTDPDIHPGEEEQCDGVDNDCSGVIDDGCGQWSLTYSGNLISATILSLNQDPVSDLAICGLNDAFGFELLTFIGDEGGDLNRAVSAELVQTHISAIAGGPEVGDTVLIGSGTRDVLIFSAPDDGLELIAQEPLWAEDRFSSVLIDVDDLDGDGDADLVAVGALSKTDQTALRVVRRDAELSFELIQDTSLTLFFEPALVTLVDLDDDSDLDLVASGDDALEWWLNDGSGRFNPGGAITFPADVGQAVVADVNGDHRPDALVTLPERWKLLLFLNHSEGDGPIFEGSVEIDSGVRHPRGLAILDVNSDGFTDLAISDEYEPLIKVQLQTVAGFAEGCVLPASPHVTALNGAMFGGGAAPDLVVIHDDEASISVVLDPCMAGARTAGGQ